MVTFGAGASLAAQPGMQVIYSFAASGDPGFGNGSGPEAGVFLGPSGDLWGTTYTGGAVACGGYNCGALYWASRAAGSQIHLIHSFKGNNKGAQDGYFPATNVVSDGNLIVGTTGYGGNPTCTQKTQPHCGVIFASHLFTDQGYQIVHEFTGGSDGGVPNDLLFSTKQTAIFGTTTAGGSHGAGTAFELTHKNNKWAFKTIYAFAGGHDGGTPLSALIEDANGNLYGTTSEGGNLTSCPANASFNVFGGCGTVFKLVPPAKAGGKWTETVLYAFSSNADGSKPAEPLIADQSGNLFGTTLYGGSTGPTCAGSSNSFLNGCGTVFVLKPSAGAKKWKESIVYRFQGYAAGFTSDGQYPRNLVLGSNNTLYGATSVGGAGNLGALFRLTKNLSGSFSYRKIFDFCPNFSSCQSGGLPNDGLSIDAANTVYGTTVEGGAGGAGAIFKFNTAAVN